MFNYDLIILAGGKGTRIKKYLNNAPKILAKFKNFFYFDLVLLTVSRFFFKNIYIIAGSRGSLIKKRYHLSSIGISKIKVIIEKKLKGTAGALFEVKNKLKNSFFLINGDTIFDINFFRLIKNSKFTYTGSLALVKNLNYMDNHKLTGLRLNKNNFLQYSKKKSPFMNGGIYYFKFFFIKKIVNQYLSLEKDVLPKLINKKRLLGKVFNSFFLDIGTPNNFFFIKKNFYKLFKKPVIFIESDLIIKSSKKKYKNNIYFKNLNKIIKFLKNKHDYYFFIVINKKINLNNLSKKSKLILQNYKINFFILNNNKNFIKKIINKYPIDLKNSIVIINRKLNAIYQNLNLKYLKFNSIK